MNGPCLNNAIETARRTNCHVYIVVPDERWSEMMGSVSALLYKKAESSGRTWLFPVDPETQQRGLVTVVPVSEEPPNRSFVLSACGWGVEDARPISKWRNKAERATSWT
jgi:hypothetical protein